MDNHTATSARGAGSIPGPGTEGADRASGGGAELPKPEATINIPRLSPPAKTDATTAAPAGVDSSNASNNHQGRRQLGAEAPHAGPPAGGPGEGEATPSGERLQAAVMSESLSKLLAYGSSSEDSDSNTPPSSVYQSDSDSDSDEEDLPRASGVSDSNGNEDKKIATSLGKYRTNTDLGSSDGYTDNEESSDNESEGAARSKSAAVSTKNPHTEGELGLDDLPPVPDLSKLDLNVKEEDCIPMGNIASIVDRLVTIQSLPNTPAYDFDTLLFLDKGKRPLGHVYDVLGQVTSPMYVIRFNSKQEIEAKGIAKGMTVYSVPNNTEHTQYVFVKQLMKIKGSDASWQGDNEVPPEFQDFSDDEAEYAFSKQNLNEQDIFDNKRKRNSLEKHKMFEVAMNLKNRMDTARYKVRDSYEPTPKRFVPQNSHPGFFYHPPPNINQVRQPCGTSFTAFPTQNFAAPPPNFPGFMSMGPVLGIGPFANQFGPVMPPFTPNPQSYPPTSFGPPTIPPLPPMPQHVMAPPQPPPPGFGGSMTMLPPPNTSALSVPPVSMSKSPPKIPPNSGVVPKVQTAIPKGRNVGPKLYIPPPAEYQQSFPSNLGLPKAAVPQFVTSAPPPPSNIPVTMPPPFGPPMPPWRYALPRTPVSMANFRPLRGNGRQYKKQ